MQGTAAGRTVVRSRARALDDGASQFDEAAADEERAAARIREAALACLETARPHIPHVERRIENIGCTGEQADGGCGGGSSNARIGDGHDSSIKVDGAAGCGGETGRVGVLDRHVDQVGAALLDEKEAAVG